MLAVDVFFKINNCGMDNLETRATARCSRTFIASMSTDDYQDVYGLTKVDCSLKINKEGDKDV